MGWQAIENNSAYWEYDGTGLRVDNSGLTSSIYQLNYVGTSRLFDSSKNYQIITNVAGLDDNPGVSFSLNLGWNKSIDYNSINNNLPSTTSDRELQFFSKPNSNINLVNYLNYKANGNFSTLSTPTNYVKDLIINEIEFDIRGFAVQTNASSTVGGWVYESSGKYIWRNGPSISKYPIGSTVSNSIYVTNNFIARRTNLESFNVSFSYTHNANLSLKMYVGSSLPDDNIATPTLGTLITPLTASGTYSFYGLVGNYLYFVGGTSSSGFVSVSIENIEITGGYHEGNNELYVYNNAYDINLPLNSTYSTLVVSDETIHDNGVDIFGATGTVFPFFTSQLGTVSNLSLLTSNLGSGTFRAGIWENGVWNSGWRSDTNVYDFNEVTYAITVNSDKVWRIQLSGPESSVANFEIGDKISIGNIVAIDINENRKLIKTHFTIINKDASNILVEVITAFPYRRIEKDSENHKIKVTKNVWLNGAFLNGYFEGIWNNGLFKGYPFLTEMYNTHWIDGVFDGGHFQSEYPTGQFVDTFYVDSTTWGIDSSFNTKLGLTFSVEHGLLEGDVITIDKDDSSLNPNYNGDLTVTYVPNEWSIITSKSFGLSSTLEGGTFTRKTATGVIQNFTFYDNNVGLNPTGSVDEKLLFNSWIDVNYSTQSASTINKNQINYSAGLGGEYSDVNLYGYITRDVLSSVSTMRDSSTSNKQVYSLGTKYKIYEDFLGDISEFNEPFGELNGGLDNFYNNGWTFSLSSTNSVATFSRNDYEELFIEFGRSSVISTVKNNILLNNNNILISKRRYSLIEFDLISTTNITNISMQKYLNSLPIVGVINQVNTSNIKKYEYFFNRNKLSILFDTGAIGYASSIIDNVKFYEVDMIPFFQYTTSDYVNDSVQIPYRGVSPVIDYSNSNFSFIESLNIGLDSISIDVSNSNSGGSSGGNNIITETPVSER